MLSVKRFEFIQTYLILLSGEISKTHTDNLLHRIARNAVQ